MYHSTGETLKWMVSNGQSYKMDDLGVPLFQETSIYSIQLKHIYIYTYIHIYIYIYYIYTRMYTHILLKIQREME